MDTKDTKTFTPDGIWLPIMNQYLKAEILHISAQQMCLMN